MAVMILALLQAVVEVEVVGMMSEAVMTVGEEEEGCLRGKDIRNATTMQQGKASLRCS